MRYPLTPSYAERREFNREFWVMLSAAIERITKRVFARGVRLSEIEGAKTCR